jgi:hypothetical protein
MQKGAASIGIGICLTTIAGFLIAVGIAFADIKKGVEAYGQTTLLQTQIVVVSVRLSNIEILQDKIDKKLDKLTEVVQVSNLTGNK